MIAFPCDSDAVRPAPRYWTRHFTDASLSLHPLGVPAKAWAILIATVRHKEGSVAVSSEAAPLLARAVRHRDLIVNLIAQVRNNRGPPYTAFDLTAYTKLGWNDHSDVRGMATIEVGLMNAKITSIWKTLASLFDGSAQAAIEAWAHSEDVAVWEAAVGNPALLAADAARLGIAPEELAITLLPKPRAAPRLTNLLQSRM